MVWKWAGFWYKGFTVCDTRQYTSFIVRNEHAAFILHVHVLEYTLQSDNYKNFQWGKEREGGSEGSRGHITPSICETAVQLQGIIYYFWWITLIIKRRIWFLPPQRTLLCILKEAMAFRLPLSCAVALSFAPHSLKHNPCVCFLSSCFFFFFLFWLKCAVPCDSQKLFRVSVLVDIAASMAGPSGSETKIHLAW